MKHIKTFEKFDQINEFDLGVFLSLFGAVAFIKIMYNFMKRAKVVGGIRNKELEILDQFIDKFKDRKALIGNIIDNDDEAQIIYEYGASDNLVVFHINKNTKEFTFRWEFTQPIFPHMKFSNDDEIKLTLDDSQYQQVMDMFNKLKNEKFKKDVFDKGFKVKNRRLL